MANIFKNFDAKKTGIFAGGVLFGTAGIKIRQVMMRKNSMQTALQLFCVQNPVS